MNDLALYVDQTSKTILTLEFIVFDQEMYLNPDGELQTADSENNDSDEVLVLNDADLVSAIGGYLKNGV